MSKTTILENESFTLWYYPEQKIIHHKFHKFIYDEDFKEKKHLIGSCNDGPIISFALPFLLLVWTS